MRMNSHAFAALGTIMLVAFAALLEANGLPALLPVVLLSAAWAYREAERLEVDRYEGWMAQTSIQVAMRVLLFWIVAFPAFLLLRQRIVRGEAEVAPGLSLSGGAPPPPRPAARQVRPERAAKLNHFAVGCAVLALIVIVSGFALGQLRPGARADDLMVLSAAPAALGIALALLSRRDGGVGFRFAASVLLVPVILLFALTFGMEFVSQPVQKLVLRGIPLPPPDLFPERADDLSRTTLRSLGIDYKGCATYSAFFGDEAGDYDVNVSAELCPDEAVVAAMLEARVAARMADDSASEALRNRLATRAEFASRTCPADPCKVRVLRQAGTRLVELSGAEGITLRLERALWRAEG